jgi:uncharacterized protein (TIGR02996 family)
MPDEKGLLAAIWDHPQKDALRLAYADWLQNTGQPASVARAEFIRLQIEQTITDEDHPRFREARTEANELLDRWGVTWRVAMPGVKKFWHWRRGFPQPDDRGINLDGLLHMSPAELRVAPSRGFSVMDAAERFDALLAWPMLDRLDTFYLRSGLPKGDWVSRALACRGLRNVCRVSLVDCPVTVGQLESLLSGWQHRRIMSLQLNGSKVGDEGFAMVLRHPVTEGLRELGVTGIGLTPAGARALAESQYHPPVPELKLGWNPLGDAGVAELVRWPGLVRIRVLNLNNAQVGDAGAAALAGCESLRHLRGLWLGQNRIGPRGAAALAASPHLKQLTRLYLHDNPLTPEAVRGLRQRFAEHLKAP